MPGRSTQLTDLLGISQLPFNAQRIIIFIYSLKENGAVAQWVKCLLHEHEDLILTPPEPMWESQEWQRAYNPSLEKVVSGVCLGLTGQPAWFSW